MRQIDIFIVSILEGFLNRATDMSQIIDLTPTQEDQPGTSEPPWNDSHRLA
jgi:hypothetical protein